MRSLPRLWLCADVEVHPPAELLARVDAALDAGVALVWLRSPPGFSARALLGVAEALREATARRGAPLVVGDRVDVAVATGADGVHLAERSLSAADARRLAGDRLIVSRALHAADGVARARGADAVVISPFGVVAGKGAALGPKGFARLRALANHTFAVALGGITDAATARAALAAGADAVAVRRALSAADPAARCAALLGALS